MDRHAHGHRPLSRAVRGSLILAGLLAATAGWAQTYRWVDETGAVHYGDSIPPQYAGQGHIELSPQGRVIKRVEPAPTSAQARQRREQAAERKERDEREARERARHDSALLATYSSAHEIELAKVRALAQEQSMLDSLQVMRLHSRTKAETDHIDQLALQHRQALDEIRTRYDADKARFIELSGGR